MMMRLPSAPADNTGDLSAVLHRNNFETMLYNARITHDWPDCQQKLDEASRQAHAALYRHALQEISDEERDMILDVLRPHCPEIFYVGSTNEDPQAPPTDVAD